MKSKTAAPEERRARPTAGALAALLLAVVPLAALLLATPACLDATTPATPESAATNHGGQGGVRQAADRAAARDPAAPGGAGGASAPGAAREADAELASAVGRVIDESELARARWGIHVISLRDGRVVYARDADRPVTPASNMKLYTTAAALALLGADYRWRTSVYAAAGPDARGTVEGDLVLYGRGAPDLGSGGDGAEGSQLAALADELYRRGVRRVGGSVVGDESYFRGEALGDGWLWQDAQWYFGAEPSALTVNGNEVRLSIQPAGRTGAPAAFKMVPPTDYVRVTNDMNTVEGGSRAAVGVTRALSSNEVRVWGEVPAGAPRLEVRLSVQRPALWAALLFGEALRARGIVVAGGARAADARARADARLDTARAVELAAVSSRPLGEVVRETNKYSLNLEAELLLRTLGRERGDRDAPVPDPERARPRNTDEAGLAVVRSWLERGGVPTDGLSLRDGSGLSRLDLVTPEATTRLLALMAASPAAEAFRGSLPVAGRDGTLAGRLRGAARGRVAAKTGALTYVDALSGYATTADGEPLAFSIICNDETSPTPATRVIDEIAALLISYPKK